MTKTHKTFNLYTISEARNVIFGIATLWIGLFHSWALTLETYTDNQFLIESFRFFRGSGNVGVDMFLFLSGVGLYFSFSKDSNVLSFWKKRLIRVLPTAVLIATFYFSYRYIINKFTSGLKYYVSRMSFAYFFMKGERVFWFISLILVLYIAFPLFYKIIEKTRIYGMLGLIAVTVGFTFLVRAAAPGFYNYWEIALCRVPGFIIGIWAGKFVKEKKEINVNWLWAFLAAAIGLGVVLYNYVPIVKSFVPGYNKDMETMYIWIYRYTGTLQAIALTVLLSWLCISIRRRGSGNILRNFFEFVGMYSMEFYMIYLNINAYLERVYNITPKHVVMEYFGSFVISLVLCVLSRKVCDFFMAYMQRKPKDVPLTEEGQLSVKWYGFLINIGLYVFIGFHILFGIARLTEGRMLIGGILLAVAALAVVTRIVLASRKPIGAILLYLVLAADPLIFILQRSRTILKGGKKDLLLAAVIAVLTAVAVGANVIYFKKRRALLFDRK